MTIPINEFIPREIDNPEIKLLLNDFASLIDEVVNYGSHVFRWGLDSIKEGDENAPAFLIYRHIFELIDSISILIRNSSIEPCNILLRSLFESFLNINYLFKSDFKQRCMDFWVWKRHKEVYSLRRFDPDDERHVQYERNRANDILLKDKPSKEIPDIKERIENLKKLFDLPSYKESAAEYERIKAVKGKPPKYWFSIHGGPNDICQLAERLGFPAQYDILYRSWSDLVHGTDIVKDKISIESPGVIAFSSLRSPRGAQSAAIMTISIGLSTIRMFASHYVPDKAKENADWYRREVEASYLRLNKIKIVVL